MRRTGTEFVLIFLMAPLLFVFGCGGGGGSSNGAGGAPQPGILKVGSANPRYFVDSDDKVVYLTGSHTWFNLQDGGLDDPPAAFKWANYLSYIKSKNHNFFRLWVWEQAYLMPESPEDFFFSPCIYNRTGPGTAFDGKPKFDLTSFNRVFFERMRARIIEAQRLGIYVSVMLFNGFSVESKEKLTNPWPGHPFNANNNINSVNGDANGDGIGTELHHGNVSELQKAYIRKVVDTVGDLSNVLYEICNECDAGSMAWQNSVADYIRSYESTKGISHPVGISVNYPDGTNDEVLASHADWVSPNALDGYDTEPPASTGRKVIISDTDHIFGVGGDRSWVWKSFTRGLNPLFMDPWDTEYLPSPGATESTFADIRNNLGYAKTFADKMNLAAMVPHGELASTDYVLANPAQTKAEYLVYLPSGGTVIVNLEATAGTLSIEWFSPASGTATSGGFVSGGGNRSFTAPFAGDAVLYLRSP